MGEYYRRMKLCFPEELEIEKGQRHRSSLGADRGLLEQRLAWQRVLSEEEHGATASSVSTWDASL